jgi:FG-GAP-like repeat
MREPWLNIENKQSEQAITGGGCNPKRAPIGITLGLLLAGITLLLSGCGSGGGGGGATPAPAAQVVSGSVQAPGGQVALFTQPSLWERAGTVFYSEAVAALSGLSSVSDGTPVQLARINETGTVLATLASTTVSGGRYSFNLTNLGISPSSDLVVRVINQGTGVQLRAFVTGETVDLNPITETAVRLVVERITLTPGTTLNQFTVTELRDITGAVHQLATVQQLAAGLTIEATVSAIQTAVASETGLSAFIVASAGPGETTEGPGDIGNYFPLTQGTTWQFQGTHAETGQPTAPFSNTITVNGTKLIGTVMTTVLAESNLLNSGVAEEDYSLKDSRGFLNYGDNDPADTLTPKLIPYRDLLFPLNLGVTSETVNKKSVDFGQDLDLPPDGKNETADVLLQVTVEKFEDVTVPKGTFTNAVKIVHKSTLTAFSSSGFGSATVIGTQTIWFAPGIGPVKRTIEIQDVTNQVTESSTEELTDHYVKSFGPSTTYSTGGLSLSQTAVSDLNGDGRGDVVSFQAGTSGPATMAVYYQTAQGQLNGPVLTDPRPDLPSIQRMAVGDLNNDGKADVLLTGQCFCPGFQGRIVVYYQHLTNGTLIKGPILIPSANNASYAAIGDLNADGRNDLVVDGEGRLFIYYQLSNGTLGPAVIYDKLVGLHRGLMKIADIDGDGDKDIVVQNDYRQFAVIKQDSSVTPPFLANTPEYYNVATIFDDFAIGDLNGDGKNDVVVATEVLVLFIQNPSGTLNPPITIPSPAASVLPGVEIADINRDGLNDLLREGDRNVYLYLQAPDHTFQTPKAYPFDIPMGGDPQALSVGDVTGDGKPDAVLSRATPAFGNLALVVLPNSTQ